MENYYQNQEDAISIGEMSRIFNISTRTLRLYHTMGLLVPQYINNSNNYRYYSHSQFKRLEKILQMKSVGLSLKQIKEMLDQKNLSVFEALLNERIDELNERIEVDQEARDLLIKQLNSCTHLRNLPNLNKPFIEFIPKRTAFVFEIEPYDLRVDYHGKSPWGAVLKKIESILTENTLSPFLIDQSCCVISQKALERGDYLCSSAYVLLDHPITVPIPQKVIQSGTYACMYKNYVAMDGESESVGLDCLLEYIRSNHYQIVGSYLGEITARMSIFDYSNNSILVKLQIPVKISEVS